MKESAYDEEDASVKQNNALVLNTTVLLGMSMHRLNQARDQNSSPF